jgi:hypothetical protein
MPPATRPCPEQGHPITTRGEDLNSHRRCIKTWPVTRWTSSCRNIRCDTWDLAVDVLPGAGHSRRRMRHGNSPHCLIAAISDVIAPSKDTTVAITARSAVTLLLATMLPTTARPVKKREHTIPTAMKG